MALTVENGDGLENADALISLAYFKGYADKFGWDYSSYADDLIEQSVRRGSNYISNSFSFSGLRKTSAQAFSFPRINIIDCDNYLVASDSVPIKVQKAVCEAGWRELVTPNSLIPDVVLADKVTSEKVGSIAVTYSDSYSSSGVNSLRPNIKVITDLIGCFTSNSSSIGQVELIRA